LLAAFVLLAACKSSDDTSDRAAPENGVDGGTSSGDDPPIPTDPAVAYVGRFLVDGDDRTASWPGSRIIARFDGPTVTAKIAETNLFDGPSVFDVTLDGRTTKLTLQEGEQTYELGKDLAAAIRTKGFTHAWRT
jgi:hypothetical protein